MLSCIDKKIFTKGTIGKMMTSVSPGRDLGENQKRTTGGEGRRGDKMGGVGGAGNCEQLVYRNRDSQCKMYKTWNHERKYL